MASNLFGNEFLPALKTLSTPIEALLPVGILVVFLLSPALHQSLLGAQLYLGDWILLCVIVTFVGGLSKVGSGEPIRQAYATIESLRTSTEYVPAIRTLSKLVGTHFKAAFSTALACYVLHISNPSTPYALFVFVLVLAASLVLGFIAPTKAFYGPLRLGYLQYFDSFFQTYEILLNWWLCAALLSCLSPFLSSFLFPLLGLCILGVFAVAWFHVYQEYQRKLQDVVRQGAEATLRAALAANYAREYANSARQYERQMLEVLAVTRRDVLLADSLNLTDFFDVAVESWAALERVTNPFDEVIKKADEIVDVAYDVEDVEKPTRGGDGEDDEDEDEESEEDDADEDEEDEDDGGLTELATDLVKKARQAVKTVKRVDSKLKTARRAVLESREAKAQTAKARNKVFTNAQEATSKADQLLGEVSGALESCLEAAQGAENAKGYAEKAIAAATMGEMRDAYNLAASANRAADEVVAAKNRLKSTRDNTRGYLVGALRT